MNKHRVFKVTNQRDPKIKVTKHKSLSREDIKVIRSLSKGLNEMGAIDISRSEILDTNEQFQDIFSEATAAAKYEKELNPDFYNEDAEAYVAQQHSARSEYDNLMLSGVDDYGNHMNAKQEPIGIPTEAPGYIEEPPLTELSENVVTEDEYADAVEGKSTIEALEESMEKQGVSSPFSGGIQNKSVDAKPFERIDFRAVKNQAPKFPTQHKKDVDPEAVPDSEIDDESAALLAKALSKARLPNGGLV